MNGRQFQLTVDSIVNLSDFLEQRKVNLLVVTLPDLRDLSPSFGSLYHKLEKSIKYKNISFLNVYPVLKSFQGRKRELWVEPSDSHPHQICHRIIGQLIVQKIKGISKEKVHKAPSVSK